MAIEHALDMAVFTKKSLRRNAECLIRIAYFMEECEFARAEELLRKSMAFVGDAVETNRCCITEIENVMEELRGVSEGVKEPVEKS